jgi:single-strand DNA-binding protein
MASLNKCSFIGNLGRDPESRFFPDGTQVCNVSIACTEKWKDKATGEQKEATEWVPLVFVGPLAKIASEYLRKGSQIYVEGALKTRKWNKDGVDRYTTEIKVSELKMLGSKADGGNATRPSAPQPAPQASRQAAPPASGTFEDDIPFAYIARGIAGHSI